jgi:two-component system OmpR family response regulator
VRILLLEDDTETGDAIARGCRNAGHRISLAHDVSSALALVDSDRFEAAVLDVMVPGGSGYDVLARLRAADPATAVLMLTARGEVEHRIEGLDRGADDYLVKPFSFAELLARLRALDRRRHHDLMPLVSGPLRIDSERRTASVRGRRLDLTPTEFGLLLALLRAGAPGMTRGDLLREVWGYDFDPRTNVVDVHVNRLRRKLEDAGLPALVSTIRGQGYAAG